ncbi:hypothetical protein P5F73_17230 [Clostridium perfringens]|nr:hypothetical protein [Clostridium perfringens]
MIVLKNANGYIDKIKSVYEYSKTQNINNFLGFILKVVKDNEFIETKKVRKIIKLILHKEIMIIEI